jgi:hypothetical protein
MSGRRAEIRHCMKSAQIKRTRYCRGTQHPEAMHPHHEGLHLLRSTKEMVENRRGPAKRLLPARRPFATAPLQIRPQRIKRIIE